jgi:hypothetical protein
MDHKICTECGIDKPLEEFYKHKLSSDGRFNTCKVCIKQRSKANYTQNKDSRAEVFSIPGPRPDASALDNLSAPASLSDGACA